MHELMEPSHWVNTAINYMLSFIWEHTFGALNSTFGCDVCMPFAEHLSCSHARSHDQCSSIHQSLTRAKMHWNIDIFCFFLAKWSLKALRIFSEACRENIIDFLSIILVHIKVACSKTSCMQLACLDGHGVIAFRFDVCRVESRCVTTNYGVLLTLLAKNWK